MTTPSTVDAKRAAIVRELTDAITDGQFVSNYDGHDVDPCGLEFTVYADGKVYHEPSDAGERFITAMDITPEPSTEDLDAVHAAATYDAERDRIRSAFQSARAILDDLEAAHLALVDIVEAAPVSRRPVVQP